MKMMVNKQKVSLLFLMYLFNYGVCQDSSCTNWNITLIGTDGNMNRFKGRLAVCNKNEWKAVIYKSWTANDKTVVCRQLGFAVEKITGEILLEPYQLQRESDSPWPVWVTSIQCIGDENKIKDCKTERNLNRSYTGPVVGIRCGEERPPQNVTTDREDGDSSLAVNVSWSSPETGQEPVQSYQVDCTSRSTSSLGYKHNIKLSVANNTYTADIDHLLPNSTYNCCVEVFFESYSSRACGGSSINTVVVEAAVSNRGANTVGGVLGFIIVVLVILLVLAGIILIYPRVIEPRVKDNGFFSRLSPWITFWTAPGSNQSEGKHTHTPSATKGTPATNINHTLQPADYQEIDCEYSTIGPEQVHRASVRDRYEYSGRHQSPPNSVACDYEVPLPLENEDEGDSPYSHLQH